ncbi:reverse transcriptase domain-containing protein [Tanacetum coccineum]|uniref:Reverse transcriptase domain-containing protein n=1 Tax=Tanacetum coccineum TaxID=301880 RepID=A0ABQ5FYR2_9ASTR
MISGPEDQSFPVNKVKEERIKVAINPEHPEQTVMIGSDLTEKTRRAETAFQTMKEHIAKLPMLTAPEEQEELIVYLAASKEAVSAVLMTEREARQMPIYFEPEDEGQDNSAKEEEPLPARCTLFTDGSSCVDECGARVILTDPEGMGVHNHLFEISVETTNKRNNDKHFPCVLNKASPKKQEQKGRCTKQNGVHQFCTSQQTGVGGGCVKEKSVERKKCSRVVKKKGIPDDPNFMEYHTDETSPAERKKAQGL